MSATTTTTTKESDATLLQSFVQAGARARLRDTLAQFMAAHFCNVVEANSELKDAAAMRTKTIEYVNQAVNELVTELAEGITPPPTIAATATADDCATAAVVAKDSV